jgi:hypothetical protein
MAVNIVEGICFGIGYGVLLGAALTSLLHHTAFEGTGDLLGVHKTPSLSRPSCNLRRSSSSHSHIILGDLCSSWGTTTELNCFPDQARDIRSRWQSHPAGEKSICIRTSKLDVNQVVSSCLKSLDCLADLNPLLHDIVRHSLIHSIQDRLCEYFSPPMYNITQLTDGKVVVLGAAGLTLLVSLVCGESSPALRGTDQAI